MLFFALMVVFFARRDYAGWADVSRVFWKPVGIVALLRLPVLPQPALAAVSVAWKALLVLSALGIFTRISTAGAFLLGTYLIGIPESFGKIHHADAILVWAMATLALSRSGDGWSVDGLMRATRRPEEPPRPRSGEYTWPIRMMWLVMSIIFFSAGVSKLRHGGLAFVTSDALATHFIHSDYGLGRPAGAPLLRVGPLVRAASHPLPGHGRRLAVLRADAATRALLAVGAPNRGPRRFFAPARNHLPHGAGLPAVRLLLSLLGPLGEDGSCPEELDGHPEPASLPVRRLLRPLPEAVAVLRRLDLLAASSSTTRCGTGPPSRPRSRR